MCVCVWECMCVGVCVCLSLFFFAFFFLFFFLSFFFSLFLSVVLARACSLCLSVSLFLSLQKRDVSSRMHVYSRCIRCSASWHRSRNYWPPSQFIRMPRTNMSFLEYTIMFAQFKMQRQLALAKKLLSLRNFSAPV